LGLRTGRRDARVLFRQRGRVLGIGIEERGRDARLLFRQRGRGLGSGIEDWESGYESPFLGKKGEGD
jgi:hypothetical protein